MHTMPDDSRPETTTSSERQNMHRTSATTRPSPSARLHPAKSQFHLNNPLPILILSSLTASALFVLSHSLSRSRSSDIGDKHATSIAANNSTPVLSSSNGTGATGTGAIGVGSLRRRAQRPMMTKRTRTRPDQNPPAEFSDDLGERREGRTA